MINKDPLLFIPADKSNNLYKTSKNTTTNYCKTTLQLSLTWQRNKAIQLRRILYLKDHKVNFKNDPKCRLFNPSKSEIGIFIKCYPDPVMNKIREKKSEPIAQHSISFIMILSNEK